MRLLISLLIVMLVLLQYKLWFSHEGIAKTIALKYGIIHRLKINQQLASSNQQLSDQISQLQSNPKAIEAIAREQMGMVKHNERYYQFVSYK